MNAKRTWKVSLGMIVVSWVFAAVDQAAADPHKVTSWADSGSDTLRWVIEQVNAYPNTSHIISFAPGITQINIESPLPSIVSPVQIDGGGVVTIDGQGGSGDGLVFETASYSPNTLQRITIQNFSGSGVVVDTTSSDLTTLQGVTLAQNGLDGLRVKASKEVKVVDDCYINGNWNYGVNVQNGGLAVDVIESYVFQNYVGGIYLGDNARGDDAAEIKYNWIYENGNTDNGENSEKGGVWMDSHGSTIQENYITENYGPGMTIKYGRENQILTNNTYFNTGAGIYHDPGWADQMQIQPELGQFVINPGQQTVTIPWSLDTPMIPIPISSSSSSSPWTAKGPTAWARCPLPTATREPSSAVKWTFPGTISLKTSTEASLQRDTSFGMT